MNSAPDIVKARLNQSADAATERGHRIASYQPDEDNGKIIAHGDSWFDYPAILGSGGGIPNFISQITGWRILNLAHHGDSTENSLGLEKRKQIEDNIAGARIFLFSGGGNDIAGDQFCLWLFDNHGQGANAAIDWVKLGHALDIVCDDYVDLVEIRDRMAPDCLIVTHGYDWPQPSDKGVCGLGPWLKPSLDYCGWTDPQDQYAIVKSVLTEFDLRISALQIENRVHVKTQGTCQPTPEFWDNEIHLSAKGKALVAQKFVDAINSAIAA